jgi:hypothetical protein
VTIEFLVVLAVLLALLAMALCAVVILLVTLPARVARLVVDELARDRAPGEMTAAGIEEIKAIAAAHRALLAEQWRIAATLRGLADWLVKRVLHGGAPPVRGRPVPRVVVPGPWPAPRSEPDSSSTKAVPREEGDAAS